jgi:hypothetical protein
MSCTDEIAPMVPLPPRQPDPLPPTTLISVNTTEAKLKGLWYLRSMTTVDTTFNDSIFNRSRFIEFSDIGYSSQNMPMVKDDANLSAKGLPTDAFRINQDAYYKAPDSGNLRIIFSYFFAPTPDTSYFTISSLSGQSLVLTDSVQKKQWKFYR